MCKCINDMERLRGSRTVAKDREKFAAIIERMKNMKMGDLIRMCLEEEDCPFRVDGQGCPFSVYGPWHWATSLIEAQKQKEKDERAKNEGETEE